MVVPTYKEKDNLRELVTRVFAALRESSWANKVVVSPTHGREEKKEIFIKGVLVRDS